MRYKFFCWLMAGLFLLAPNIASAEVWEYACSEAITLLRQAQQEVVHKQYQLRQAKLALRIPRKEMEVCRSGHGGFDGGHVYCVRHRSSGWNGLGEVNKAADALQQSVSVFEEHFRVMGHTCLPKLD